MDKLSNRILNLRNENKLTQKELVDNLEIDISAKHLGNIENNRANPSFELLIEISNFFNVSVDYLLGLTDVKNIENDIDLEEIILKSKKINYKNIEIPKDKREDFLLIIDNTMNIFKLLHKFK